jgi:DNA-binding beta-propeller fold protein YncE
MIHSILRAADEVPDRVVETFDRECEILSALHHPNIVQFVGVSRDRWIVMECLHASLIDYIDDDIRTQKCLHVLSLQQKLKILYDVALGVQYLHERDKPILHRDLTARNVLLTKDLRAKIADLGQAIVKQYNHRQYMSQAPGTLCYMPPEVLKFNPKYDQSIDIFSFGVLILHTISELLPVPELDAQIFSDRSGEVIGTRTEIERRPRCVEKLRTMPQLTSLVEQCMHNSAKHRPPIMLVIGRLALGISDKEDSTANILAVSYSNKELDHTNYNLKITLASVGRTSPINKLCAIVQSPITIGFTGTYKETIPFHQIKISCPRDIAIAKYGCVYVCDYDGKTGVLAYSPTSGITTAIIRSANKTDSKKSSISKCWYPLGIAMDDCGNIYLSDTHNHRVLKYSTKISGILGCAGEMLNKGSRPSQFDHPSGIAVSGDLVYVCDTENHRVQILNSCHLHVEGEFCSDDMQPVDIAIDKEGRFVYVLDCTNKNIRVFQEGTLELLHTIDLTVPQYLKLQRPVGICVDTKHFVYITDEQKHGVLVLDAAGKFKIFFGTRGSREGEFNKPAGIDVDSQGNVYVCDSGNGRVQIFS